MVVGKLALVCALLWQFLWIASPAIGQNLFSAPNPLSSNHAASNRAVVQTPQVRAELVALAPEGIAAGDTIHLGLLLEHASGWHTYWKNPGDSGLPTELNWQLPSGWQAGAIQWPTPLKLRIGELANYGYEGRTLLPVAVTIPADWTPDTNHGTFARTDEVTIALEANWLVCKLECIPESGQFTLTLPTQTSTGLYAQDFQNAWSDIPVEITQSIHGSHADAQGDRLMVHIEGLPEHLQGQQLELFIDEPQVVTHGARAQKEWQQRWDGTAWQADIPLALDRQASGKHLNIVITRLSQSEGGDWDPTARSTNDAMGWQLQVPITTGWPATLQAQPSPALLQALADNAQAASTHRTSEKSGLPVVASTQTTWSLHEWAWMLLFAFAGGALLNLMPCVFPVLAIKALSIVQSNHSHTSQRRSAWAYGAGVVVSFAAMGAAVLALRSAGAQLGWGFQLQSPWFVAALALLFTVMGLALAGAVQFGLWVPQRWRSAGASQGASAAFASGVLASLVASPCTGPFMGAALGAALSFPVAAAMGIFLVMGIGMALPLMALVWFPQLINRLPRPGAWMETFRNAMAFPMFATVVWLLWVLANQVGINAMVAWLAVLWALSFSLWLIGKRPAGQHNVGLQVLWLAVLALPLAIAAWSGRYFALTQNAPSTHSASAASEQGLWQDWSAQTQADSLAAQRPVFVDFTATWCITCQYNKMTTLADNDVLADFAAANVLLLRADWTRQNPAITQALNALGRTGVPTYALHMPGQAPVVMMEILDKTELRAQLKALATP
ncbi:protein-disulfide reductase [Lampropedia puyangensis]|uniref:Protein-disulfide reductase n=2 Tax=Lampropedia puyangensis TaxID=1330072 RepID=A0A4S8F2K3_9BURK|nr:protein-disulfide reductase [Lampropedia puyangensis]